MKNTIKTVEVELVFRGTGRIEQTGLHAFEGGIVEPDLSEVAFALRRQEFDSLGILNPVGEVGSVAGSFQLELRGTSAGFRELGRYFLALAELDTSAHEGFHVHFDELRSRDGRTHVHAIVRKEDVRPSRDSK